MAGKSPPQYGRRSRRRKFAIERHHDFITEARGRALIRFSCSGISFFETSAGRPATFADATREQQEDDGIRAASRCHDARMSRRLPDVAGMGQYLRIAGAQTRDVGMIAVAEKEACARRACLRAMRSGDMRASRRSGHSTAPIIEKIGPAMTQRCRAKSWLHRQQAAMHRSDISPLIARFHHARRASMPSMPARPASASPHSRHRDCAKRRKDEALHGEYHTAPTRRRLITMDTAQCALATKHDAAPSSRISSIFIGPAAFGHFAFAPSRLPMP